MLIERVINGNLAQFHGNQIFTRQKLEGKPEKLFEGFEVFDDFLVDLAEGFFVEGPVADLTNISC